MTRIRYLLDTNICIYIIKDKPAAVRECFERLRPGEAGISAVTEAELRFGAEKSQRVAENLAAILDFTSRMDVLPFGSVATAPYGKIRANLTRQGQPIGPLDFLIAATALAQDLTLVTNNTGEFQRVPGLRLEDWTK
ncbi:type II toxin-antitoxin system VapC family toxin [Deinococcus rubellus]|uniref:type II toxin-antitoxin system tRNA(fMet)-specific endonuclease VapC n=1 Tax=Deinococcus rubellus TaxID=1889240 RepID=UPI0031EDBBBC